MGFSCLQHFKQIWNIAIVFSLSKVKLFIQFVENTVLYLIYIFCWNVAFNYIFLFQINLIKYIFSLDKISHALFILNNLLFWIMFLLINENPIIQLPSYITEIKLAIYIVQTEGRVDMVFQQPKISYFVKIVFILQLRWD